MYHTLNIDNNESKNNHESLTKDDGEMIEESDAECSDPNDETKIRTIIQTKSRGNGRLALLKTGKLGRLRKVYQPDETPRQDPKSSREMMPSCD